VYSATRLSSYVTRGRRQLNSPNEEKIMYSHVYSLYFLGCLIGFSFGVYVFGE
jgi:hypothetical protein